MGLIKNYYDLAINSKREIVLDLIEEGLKIIKINPEINRKDLLQAIQNKAFQIKLNAEIYSDNFQSEAELAGKSLIKQTKPHSILIAIGETSHLKLNQEGKGGRNQILILASLYNLDENTVIAAINTSGFDESIVAGAIGDFETLEKAKKLGINPLEYLQKDNSFVFFKNVQDAIITDRLATNISDLIIIYKQ